MNQGLRSRPLAGVPLADNENGDPCRPSSGKLDEAGPIESGDCAPGADAAASLFWHPAAAETAVPAEDPPHVGLFQDVPRSIWTVFLAGWAGFFLLMWLYFAIDANATFMVTVAMLFGLMAFGLPIAMARQSNNPAHRCSGMIQTHTGPVTVGAAGIQIALIPVAVVIGLLGFILFAK